MTINDLYKACLAERRKGNGSKRVLLSNDDEWNGFHQAFSGCHTLQPTDLDHPQLPYGIKVEDISDFVVIG